jgi:organic radical activating enzyme
MASCLYIKANGEIPCWCGVGEKKNLCQTTEETDFVHSVLFGKAFEHIRTQLSRGSLPWPALCKLCVLLDRKSPFNNKLIAERTIDSIQLEPSYLCNLDCSACIPSKKNFKWTKGPPYNMSLNLLQKLINDLKKSEFSVGSFDFQGRGEPLMNHNIWKMISYVRMNYPDSYIETTTNGNFEYNPDSIHAGLSKIVMSVDGCYQDSYVKYRKEGNIDMAFKLLERFADEKRKYGKQLEVVWKYILFGHNDSDKELIDAQKKALEIGVDTLIFHVTPFVHSCKRSRFFKSSEKFKFPKIDTSNSSLKILYPDENNPANIFMEKANSNKLAYIAWVIIKSILSIKEKIKGKDK